MSFASLCLLTILVHVPSAEAGSLRGQPLPAQMNRTDVETLLLSELSNAFRDGAAREHISSLEVELQGMYTAVPKDASGRLGYVLVRYMLHRFFVEKHGWFIRGLEPGNASALQAKDGNQTQLETHNLQEWVPAYLQKFIKEIQGGRGIDLRELAVLAATLEDLIHKESNQRLEMAFVALELPLSTPLNSDQLQEALETYMMLYTSGGDFPLESREIALAAQKILATTIGQWKDLQQLMHSVQVEVAPGSIEKPLDFTGASRIVEEFGRRYGTYNDAACVELKSEILQIESTKAGRVRLADFYKKGLLGVFQFNEKIEYLRALGTIDESNASDPYLIVPNYIASRPNCISPSDFYVVCCRNECEDLFATVEKKFKKPMANPEQILGLVASFSTKTVEAPRTLSDTLVRRLNLIAEANEGQVPLHGRLFAQWMHHAFPRECPYPQQSDDVAPMTADEWMHATGHESAKKTNEEMQVIVDSDSCILPIGEKAREHHGLAENELPWDEVEELLHPAKDYANDVVTQILLAETRQAVIPEALQPSLFGRAAPAFFILSAAAFVWKVTRNMKGYGWRDGLMV